MLFLPRDEGRGEGGVPVVVVVVVASIPKKDFLPPWSSAPKSDISLVSGLVVVGTCPPPPPPPALCSVPPVFCLGGGRRLPLVKMSFSSSSISRRRWCRLLNFRTFFNPSGASFSPSSSSSSVSSASLASSSLNFFVFKDVLLLARIVLAEISSLGGTIRAPRFWRRLCSVVLISRDGRDYTRGGGERKGACGLLNSHVRGGEKAKTRFP